MSLVDVRSRPIDYLRISVTDRCNLRCIYCMPPEGVPLCSHSSILRYEEIETIVRVAVAWGIRRVRLTGGEPLVRQGIVDLVDRLANVPGIVDLSMTTNGVLLSRYARLLARAGLDRINISLDTLLPERYRRISRLGRLEDVLSGIDAALEAGLAPTKINTVIMRGVNDDEVMAFAKKTVCEGWNVRFIELMPIGRNRILDGTWSAQLVTAAEIRRAIEATCGPLEAVEAEAGGGPARYRRLRGARGILGFIAPTSEQFCDRCNRLRLTADGQLRPCLLSNVEIDVRTPLRQGGNPAELKLLFDKAAAGKPLRHPLEAYLEPKRRAMSGIGG